MYEKLEFHIPSPARMLLFYPWFQYPLQPSIYYRDCRRRAGPEIDMKSGTHYDLPLPNNEKRRLAIQVLCILTSRMGTLSILLCKQLRHPLLTSATSVKLLAGASKINGEERLFREVGGVPGMMPKTPAPPYIGIW